MLISKEKLAEALPDCRKQEIEAFHEDLNEAMEEFEINTPRRMAAFLAQCAHESGNFRTVRENLNYSADGLKKIFPKYFKDRDASQYHRQPEKIANVVYSGRMGNGDEASGDGWRFCGRGLIQLTGKTNYEHCGEALEVDVVGDPKWLETPEGASWSAAWFWDSRDLNDLADAGDIKMITKRINGGFIGLEDRIEHYETALEALGE
jgi:putative chitinase